MIIPKGCAVFRKFPYAITFLLLGLAPLNAAGFDALASHRAVYEVTLLDAEDRSGIETMNGRIVYEVLGNTCQGMSTKYRFVTRIATGRDSFVTDLQSASHESADGSEFFFVTKSFVNDQQDQDVNGKAVRTSDGISVSFKGEDQRELELDSAIFTTAHLLAVLESAKKGEVFVSHTIFDGIGDADKLLNSAAVIGAKKTVTEQLQGEGDGDIASLREMSAWPVTMSYFNTNPDNTAEAIPIYESNFLLYDNGISRDLTMRYPDYSLKAVLSELEYLDAGVCE